MFRCGPRRCSFRPSYTQKGRDDVEASHDWRGRKTGRIAALCDPLLRKKGLLPLPLRSGGQRRYDRSILARLAVLERAKRCGFTLEEVRALFNDSGGPSERWQRIACRKLAELDA